MIGGNEFEGMPHSIPCRACGTPCLVALLSGESAASARRFCATCASRRSREPDPPKGRLYLIERLRESAPSKHWAEQSGGRKAQPRPLDLRSRLPLAVLEHGLTRYRAMEVCAQELARAWDCEVEAIYRLDLALSKEPASGQKNAAAAKARDVASCAAPKKSKKAVND